MLSLIPISDANPTRRTPYVTIALIALNVILFLRTPGFGQGLEGSIYFFQNAPIPCQLQDVCRFDAVQLAQDIVVPITDRGPLSFLGATVFSTFLHAGWLHLLGNMLFLWVFGNNVEDFLGHVKYTVFYLFGGIAASLAHDLINLKEVVPSVGASGAVAAVMGAYLVLFPRARVNVLVPIFFIFTIVQMSAIAVLVVWFLYQFLIGLRDTTVGGGVAWMAHVGGFVFGAIAIYVLGGRPHREPTVSWEQPWR